MNALLLFCLLALCLYSFRGGVWKRDKFGVTGLPQVPPVPHSSPAIEAPRPAPRTTSRPITVTVQYGEPQFGIAPRLRQAAGRHEPALA